MAPDHAAYLASLTRHHDGCHCELCGVVERLRASQDEAQENWQSVKKWKSLAESAESAVSDAIAAVERLPIRHVGGVDYVEYNAVFSVLGELRARLSGSPLAWPG